MKSTRTILSLYLFLLGIIASSQNSEQINFLPKPDGKFQVGHKTFELKDSTRTDLYHKVSKRVVTFEVWYPAEDNRKSSENYFGNKVLLKNMLEQAYNHLDSTEIMNMSRFQINAKKDARPNRKHKYPLIIFSPGMGVSRKNYQMFFENFASHGYIVAAIDHPYSGFMVTQGGRLLSSRQDTLLYTEEYDQILLERMKEQTKDIHLVIENLINKKSSAGKFFSGVINQNLLAVIGHSLGGNVALEYSNLDSRVKAAVNLDGGVFNNLSSSTSTPLLILRSQPIYDLEDLKAKGRSEEEWQKMQKEVDDSFQVALEDSKEAYEIKIPGSGHMSFSDAPFVAPTMISRFGGKVIDPNKGFEIIFDATKTFLEYAFYNSTSYFDFIEDCKRKDLCRTRTYIN